LHRVTDPEDQHFSPNERYATGLRNGEGFAFDAAGRLFVTMHGRDLLSQNWPSLFTADDRGFGTPSVMVRVIPDRLPSLSSHLPVTSALSASMPCGRRSLTKK
jgi:hypothetical protein